MLRRPNEMVTASKVSSANGQPGAVAGGERQVGPVLLADLEHAEREVARDDVGAGVGERLARRAGAGREVEHPLARQRRRRRG